MKLLLAALSLLLIAPAPVKQPKEIAYGAVARVLCGPLSGTAFHIGNGRYITALHVVSNAPDECTIGTQKVTVTGQSKDLDIAELSGPSLPAKLEVNCSGFSPGRQYLAIGYAGGVYRTNLPLIYSRFGPDPENGNGQFIGADMIPGMSGGPLIGEDYRVWGVNLQRWPSRARDLHDTYLCRRA